MPVSPVRECRKAAWGIISEPFRFVLHEAMMSASKAEEHKQRHSQDAMRFDGLKRKLAAEGSPTALAHEQVKDAQENYREESKKGSA